METEFVFTGFFLRAYEFFVIVSQAHQLGLVENVRVRVGDEGLAKAHQTQGKHHKHLIFALGIHCF